MTWTTNSSLLVVDDDVYVRKAMVQRLSASGFNVLQATDAEEAIRILEIRDDIDLVCSDIEMPGSVDGVDLAALVRDRWPLIKMVLMSGRAQLSKANILEGSKFIAKAAGLDAIGAAVAKMMLEDPRLRLLTQTPDHNFAA